MKIGMRIDIDPSVCGIITNGDVIKALWDVKHVLATEYSVIAEIGAGDDRIRVNKDFWNAPYKREGE